MNVFAIELAFRHYVVSALWSELDDEGEPLDARFDADDIDEAASAKMRADVKAFIEGCESERPEIFDGMDSEQIGHDFWLTRNGHGAGFWDRGLGERGDWLTQQCKIFGGMSLVVGDDGKLYYE